MKAIEEILELKEKSIRAEQRIKELEEELKTPIFGNMSWLREQLNASPQVIKASILYPFEEELKKGIVYYTDGNKGTPWRVNCKRFREWVEENGDRIEWRTDWE